MSKSDPTPPLEGSRSGTSAEVFEKQQKDAKDAPSESPWLALARQSYTDSTSWLDANLSRQWQRNIENFRSQHPSGSKYHTNHYKFRSKAFRPKTRAARKGIEANAAIAFFTNQDRLEITPIDNSRPENVVAAKMIQEVTNIRLRHTIPWYKVCLGGIQDAGKHGIVVSHQYWKYKTIKRPSENFFYDDEPIMEDIVTHDEPCIELVSPENLRIDPSCDWLDPVETSPFIIHLIPMYLQDVMVMLQESYKIKWIEGITKADLEAAASSSEDNKSLRQTREGPRQDRFNETASTVRENDVIWVHRNIMRVNGNDFVYYTAGTHLLLSEPVHISEHYPHLKPGERPYTFGISSIESHVVYPQSPVEQTEQLQHVINEITNQRIDNVRLAMNGRYLVRRGKNIDMTAIRHSVPGGIAETENPDEDVKLLETKDVTGSAYQEQDRAAIEFDEMAGSFSGSSIQSNRRMNETVGGMRLLAGSASMVTEYEIRTISETWIRPTMRQLVQMIQTYESDEQIIATAAAAADAARFLGEEVDADSLLRTEVLVNVNLGLGATDPIEKANNLLLALQNAMGVPGLAAYMNGYEIGKEIFSILGYGNGAKFLINLEEDPRVMEMQAQIAELEQKIATDEVKLTAQREMTQMRADSAERIQQMKMRIDILDRLIADEEQETKRAELELQRAALLDSMGRFEREMGHKEFMDAITTRENAETMKGSQAKGKAGTVSRDDFNKIPHSVG